MRTFVRGDLTFDVSDRGPGDGRLVVVLHGFPEDRHCWDDLSGHLVRAGCRVLAPDQRGYSPGARPAAVSAYRVRELCADVLALADTAGARRFDLIGHDWGAVVAWSLAAFSADRVRTLTALSVPHPRAFADSLLRSSQALHSWYMLAFQIPALPELLFRRAGPRAADLLVRDGLDRASAERYAARLSEPGAATGPLNWYRALRYSLTSPVPDVSVPTLLAWGDRDRYLTRWGAERSALYVRGPYRFEAIAGASHWLPSTSGDALAPLLLEHLGVASELKTKYD